LGYIPLLWGLIEYRGAILAADIVTLSVELGRIVSHREEQLQQLAEADPCRIIMHLDDFGMPGFPGTNRLVVRGTGLTASITRGHTLNTVDRQKHRFHTPEAAPRQHKPGLTGGFRQILFRVWKTTPGNTQAGQIACIGHGALRTLYIVE